MKTHETITDETMTDETILDQIDRFADQAHGDQRRKYTPDRYIVHPRRVMEICRQFASEVPVLAAALLHDVLEDTPVSDADLGSALNDIFAAKPGADKTLRLVIELTDVYEKSAFPQLNRRQRKAREIERMRHISPQAQSIKYADIIDNCQEIVQHDRSFAPVFLRECGQLLDVMDKGDEQLRNRARTVLSEAWKRLD